MLKGGVLARTRVIIDWAFERGSIIFSSHKPSSEFHETVDARFRFAFPGISRLPVKNLPFSSILTKLNSRKDPNGKKKSPDNGRLFCVRRRFRKSAPVADFEAQILKIGADF